MPAFNRQPGVLVGRAVADAPAQLAQQVPPTWLRLPVWPASLEQRVFLV